MRLTPIFLLMLIISFILPTYTQVSIKDRLKRIIKVYAPAIARSTEGLSGVVIEIELAIESPGRGDVYFSVSTLTEIDMQASAKVAALVASEIANKRFQDFNFYVKVISDAPIVGGPSAGALMTVAFIAALANLSLRKDVMMTGMINPDGTIGPVGGIYEKAEAAHKFGIKLFLIPYGQEIVKRIKIVKERVGPIVIERTIVEELNITEYAWNNWRMQVKEVADIREALFYFTGKFIGLSIPSLKLSIPSETKEFLREMYLDLYQSTRELLNKTKVLIGNVSNSLFRRSLTDLIKEAEALEKQASLQARKGRFYVAASLAFRAAFTAQYALNLIRYDREGDDFLSNEIQEINSTINELTKELINLKLLPIEAAEIIIAAKLRIKNALKEFKSGLKLLRKDLSSALWKLAFSLWRIKTAKSWLWLIDRIPKSGKVLNIDSLAPLARDYIYEAQTVVVYARQILTEAGAPSGLQRLIQVAWEWLEEAKQDLIEGDPLLALAESIEAITYSCTAMLLLLAKKEVILEQARISHRMANAFIFEALMMNATPILALCYLEYADYSYERGEYENAILSYKDSTAYAKIVMSIYRRVIQEHESSQQEGIVHVPKRGKPESPKEGEKSKEEEMLKTLTKKEFIQILVAFIIGLIVGILVKPRRRKLELYGLSEEMEGLRGAQSSSRAPASFKP